jgi:hypothetical protein
MKKAFTFLCMLLIGSGVFYSCQDDQSLESLDVSDAVRGQLIDLGFDVINFAPLKFEQGFLVEGDIYLTPSDLSSMGKARKLPNLEQYSTNNLVASSGGRTITIYAPVGGKNGYSSGMIAGLDLAISRYNAENLTISFQRVTSSSSADILMTRLSKGDERRGILGSSGFPTASGDPYGEIKMSGILESSYNLSTAGIATIIAHEIGHCVGFRHTDYYNRAISCGGGASNEGDAGIGANLIPGTPATATLSAKSYMLACTNGGDRPFNNDDKTALSYLY